MNRIGPSMAIFFLATIMVACAASPDVGSDEGVCLLKAVNSDVYVRAFQLDGDGNMGPLIWQGRINRGQTARIKTTDAYLRYFYNPQPDIDQPFKGGIDAECDDLDVVSVP
jgi:hypothetical protein